MLILHICKYIWFFVDIYLFFMFFYLMIVLCKVPIFPNSPPSQFPKTSSKTHPKPIQNLTLGDYLFPTVTRRSPDGRPTVARRSTAMWPLCPTNCKLNLSKSCFSHFLPQKFWQSNFLQYFCTLFSGNENLTPEKWPRFLRVKVVTETQKITKID